MTDQLAAALSDLEDRLFHVLDLVRRAQHGSPHALRELDRYTVHGGATDPFMYVHISHELESAIRDQSLRCPSAPGSEH